MVQRRKGGVDVNSMEVRLLNNGVEKWENLFKYAKTSSEYDLLGLKFQRYYSLGQRLSK